MPSPLAALSPLDGRYAATVDPLRAHFSEQALIRYRIQVELGWLQALAAERAVRELPAFSAATREAFAGILEEFSEEGPATIQRIEGRTIHDVKAIEYWSKDRLGANRAVQRSLEFVDFACTSEGINNVSCALMLARSREEVMLPALDGLV